MNKQCPTCKGRGRWQEKEITYVRAKFDDNEQMESITIVWKECLDCHGSGIKQDPDDGPDFDIGGDSYADED